MILPKVRDPRFVTIRRGGTLTDADHRLLALWAASCAEHVLGLFESAHPEDARPRQAIEHVRAWVRGEVKMMQARAAGGHAMGAARDLRGAARHAAYAAGQAGAVAHVAAHELGAAAYAIKAARAAAPNGLSAAAGRLECQWQRDQLPKAIRQLVLDDQRLRNDICWSVFDLAGPRRKRILDAEAYKSIALPTTSTYIVVHGTYFQPIVDPVRTARVLAALRVCCSAPGSDPVQRHQQARRRGATDP